MIPMQKLWVDPAKLPEMTEELFIETVTVAALALERMDFLIEANANLFDVLDKKIRSMPRCGRACSGF
jgi:hypothetical protein